MHVGPYFQSPPAQDRKDRQHSQDRKTGSEFKASLGYLGKKEIKMKRKTETIHLKLKIDPFNQI